MTARTWPLVVRDAHRRAHRGIVVLSDRAPVRGNAAGDAFRIVLVSKPLTVRRADDATAICIPRGTTSPGATEAGIALSPSDSAAYRGGRIETNGPPISAQDVFPVRGGRPRLDRIARAIVAAGEAETLAAYAAVIRHELRLAPGADAAAALRARLSPVRASDRPPARAPAVARLRAALRQLERHAAPARALEQFSEDLRFLRVFDADEPWSGAAASRLLRDVGMAGTRRPAPVRARRLRVVRGEDAQ